MSSTQRGGQRSAADFYETPGWPVHRLLERCALPGGGWLECSAGNGAIIRAVNEVRTDVDWSAVELRGSCRKHLTPLCVASQIHIGDFLEYTPRGGFEVVITNPPFSIAEQVLAAALKLAPWVVMLLRLNFFGSEQRNEFFQRCMPDSYVIPDRVSFTLDGKADSIEYAWMVFNAERNRRRGFNEVLNCTPLEERKAKAVGMSLLRSQGWKQHPDSKKHMYRDQQVRTVRDLQAEIAEAA